MEQKEKNIHWFPGHMKKAGNEIEEKLKLVDFVIILLDARAPRSTYNKYLEKIIKNKTRLYILNKIDLADDVYTKEWISKLKGENSYCLGSSLKNNAFLKEINAQIENIINIKKEKYNKRGIVNFTSRALVIGIPNVGKSTFINFIAKKSLMGAQNTPGFTKKITWAKINKHFELLDTPGILMPSFDDKISSIHLALIGAIKETILPLDEIIDYLLTFLKNNYFESFSKFYDANLLKDDDNIILLSKIATRRGLILSKERLDLSKAQILIFNDFKNGHIGKMTLERV